MGLDWSAGYYLRHRPGVGAQCRAGYRPGAQSSRDRSHGQAGDAACGSGKMRRLAKLLLLPCLVVLLMGADNQEARYQNLGGKIMCSCGCAQMLLKCNHVGCQNSDQMTRELRANVQSTSNDEEVLNWFRRKWGVTAVVEPSTHGFELVAWILPVAGLGVGLLLVILLIRNWKLRTAPVAAADLNLDPELEALRARAHRETEI